VSDQIVIPLAPHLLAPLLLGGLVLSGIFLWSGAGRALMGERMAQRWSGLTPVQRAATGLGLAAWAILFLATLAAALLGVLRMAGDGAAGTLGLGTLLAALLGAPFLIWATLIRQATVDYQKEGHMTDRISKAVEQLGAEKTVKKAAGDRTVETTEPNLEVRIGAILSLERIAQDSTRHDRGRDHVRVMEILCAYIRDNAPASGAKDHDFGEWTPLPDDATEEQRAARQAEREARFGTGPFRESKVMAWARSLGPPRADIAEALKVIGRRSRDQLLVEAAWPHPPTPDTGWPFDNAPHLPDDPDEAPHSPAARVDFENRLRAWKDDLRQHPGHRLDLRNTNLQGADLSKGCFQGARFDNARLDGADLRQARLEGADLWQARVEGANLWEARLEGASLFRARMEGADLWRARLAGANLEQARLEATTLFLARMEGASLAWAELEEASLEAARLDGAELSLARMGRANFRRARLPGTSLRSARLEGANLQEARFDAHTDVRDAELSGASWQDVDLSMLDLTQAQIDATFGDGSVILPARLARPAHWPTEALHTTAYFDQIDRWWANRDGITPPPSRPSRNP
jgi:uncharacterized protein YjbI with pentapeptide repeats